MSRRLLDPVYGRRALEFVADALLAAAAFALAFKLRFLDVPGGIPERYEAMLAGSIVFVALGKALVIELFGLHSSGGATSACPTSGRWFERCWWPAR